MTGPRLALRDGWRPAVAGLAMGGVTTAIVATSTTSALGSFVTRGAVAGLVILAVGLAIGSDRLVGSASLPVLGAALLGADQSGGLVLGRSIIIGCLWYVTLELCWASIELRSDTARTAALGLQRIREVATVVVGAVVVGLGGLAAASVAPTRTVLVRVVVVAAVLVATAAAVRQLAVTSWRTEPTSDPS